MNSYSANSGEEALLSAMIDQAEGEMGETGVLIYNAVAPTFVKPTALSVDQLVTDFRVNVAGALVATKQVLPGMKARNQGTILFTGGGWARNPGLKRLLRASGKREFAASLTLWRRN